MKEWKVDIPVLLIFFTRSDTFEKVFEQGGVAMYKVKWN